MKWALGMLAAVMILLAGCGGGDAEPEAATDPASDVLTSEAAVADRAGEAAAADATDSASESFPAAEAEPTATPEPEPTATPEPEPTVAPTATPVPEPTPTPTPEPLNVVTLADAMAGTPGTNWAANLGGEEVAFVGFVEPDGEPFPNPDGVLDFVEYAVVFSGTPDDEWVEIDIGWAGNGSTAWIRTADYDFTRVPAVFEIVRGTGELRLWEAGEVIWEATNLAPRERTTELTPLAIGSVTGLVDAEQFSGRFGPEFHPQIISVSILLERVDEDFISPVGIRGFTDGVYIEGTGQGVQIWVSSAELEELIALMPPGTRVEIVE